ncbi:MAG: putative Glycosyltransferase [Nitrospira sp.]|jgi:glycosyltransferase involved in cell wall biosynthesis|nr:putative Glycosyltransferase [Nitrospira sp.]
MMMPSDRRRLPAVPGLSMANFTPRVLSVVPGLPIGFNMIFARNQIAALEQLGVISRSFFLHSRTSPGILLSEAARFRREVAGFRPDLVHAHYGTVTALFCAALTRLPLVITFQGSDLNRFWDRHPLRPPAGRVMSQLAALRAAGIICVSRQLKGRLWWKAGKAKVIPSGVDMAVFHPVPKHEARASCGWLDGEKVVISSAGTGPVHKRLDLAQAAVRVAESLCGKIRFVVLDGSKDQESVATMFNAADCFLLTSMAEGSPNVIKEAMACDLPVVSVDVGDVRERLRDVHPSKIIGDDPQKLGAALSEILRMPARSNGSQAIRLDLTAERMASKVLALYREVMDR